MASSPGQPPRLPWSAVCARRLQRHALLAPLTDVGPARVAAAICGVHAQVLTAAEWSIGLRLTGVTRSDIGTALWTERTLVKTFGPRGTVHLLPAEDLPLWTAALSAVPWAPSELPEGTRLTPGQVAEVSGAIAGALLDGELTIGELTDAVVARTGTWAGDPVLPAFGGMWPRWRQVTALAAIRGELCFGPNRGRNVTYTKPRRWLPGFRQADPQPALAELVRRYLHSYGPATPGQFAQWLGAPRSWAAELFGSLAGELQQAEQDGAPVWLSAGDTAMPSRPPQGVRLLPYFDAYAVGSHPRAQLFAGRAAERALSRTGQAETFPAASRQHLAAADRLKPHDLLLPELGRETSGTAAQLPGPPFCAPGVAASSISSSVAANPSRPVIAARSCVVSVMTCLLPLRRWRLGPAALAPLLARLIGGRLTSGEHQHPAVLVDGDRDGAETECPQPDHQRCRLDRVVGVADVEVVQVVAGQAVRTDQNPARPQHPERLGQDLVLRGRGGDVVQHRERAHRVEGRVAVPRSCGVSHVDSDIAAGKARGQRRRGGLVRFQRRQPAHPVPQPLGGCPGSRADFEQAHAEVGGCRHGREDVGLQVLGPLRAPAQLLVVRVHDPDATGEPGCRQRRRIPSCVARRTMCAGAGPGGSGHRADRAAGRHRARRVGYDTPSAFVAAFRRETGLTPAVYFRAQPAG